MPRSFFEPLRDVDADLVRVQDRIASALEAMWAALPSTILSGAVTLIAAGSNGIGIVQLPAVKSAAGDIIARARVGAQVAGVIDLTSNVSRQALFEPSITADDQIRQTSTTNLAGATLLFVLVS